MLSQAIAYNLSGVLSTLLLAVAIATSRWAATPTCST
jgi:hypothetical protein